MEFGPIEGRLAVLTQSEGIKIERKIITALVQNGRIRKYTDTEMRIPRILHQFREICKLAATGLATRDSLLLSDTDSDIGIDYSRSNS